MAQQAVLTREPFLLPDPTRDVRWDRARLCLLAGFLVLFAGVLLLGEHVVPLARLDAAVTSGRVTQVRLSAVAEPGATGGWTRLAHWTEGTRRYVVTVTEVVGDSGSSASSHPVVRGRLEDRLRRESPTGRDLSLPHAGTGPVAWSEHRQEMLGRRVPAWVSSARLGLYLGALLVLSRGPEPWRARRWAWFWFTSLFGLQTLGVLAFLALSGPTPLLAPPRPGRRRLGGGWAFLVSLLLAGVGGSA